MIFRQLAEQSPDWLYIVGNVEGCLYCSPACEQVVGHPPEAFYSDPNLMQSLIVDEDRESFLRHRREAGFHGEEIEFRIRHRDGSIRYIAHRCFPLQGEDGQYLGRYGINRDVTKLKYSEGRLRYLSLAIEQAPISVMLTSTTGEIEYVNPEFSKISGYSAAEVVGKTPRILKSGQVDQATYQALWGHLKAGREWTGELINRRKNGEIYHEWEWMGPVRSETGEITHYLAIKEDVTLRRWAALELQHRATHDSLTNLPNRWLFEDRLNQALARSKRDGLRGAVMLLDLDNFKIINDSLGHSVGDALLSAIAVRLQGGVREGDTVARLGGDEFGILLTSASSVEETVAAAERLQLQLAEPLLLERLEFLPSASLGLCFYPDDGVDGETLMRHADIAMYAAKKSGRGKCAVYEGDMEGTAAEDYRILTRLRVAIETNSLELLYQPQVDTETGRIVGAEALLRWNDEELGSVSPARFIPLAEASGLILRIGDWVIESVCERAADWLRQGMALKVAINVSPQQFRQRDLAHKIGAMVERHQCQANLLELEITESMAMEKAAFAKTQLDGLVALGMSIALDDFGTGHSSLARLAMLPITKLKIDRSFIVEVPGNEQYESILRATIGLADDLGMSLVAEGVETEAQRRFLQGNGCRVCQGWLFSKAIAADDLLELVRNSALADGLCPE